MGIYAKLLNIQRELFVPKGNRNDFGKYNYRSCEDICKTVKPLLDKYQCSLFMANEMICVGDRNYVEAIVTLVDLESGETISSKAQAREEETKKGMDGSQITGTSSSYARKYALAGLFCIDNEKDSDATNKGEDTKSDDLVEDAKRRSRILKYINSKNEPAEVEKWICERYMVEKSNNLSTEQQIDLIEQLTKKGETI